MNPRRRRINRKDRKARAFQVFCDHIPWFGRPSAQMTEIRNHEVVVTNLQTGYEYYPNQSDWKFDFLVNQDRFIRLYE